MNMTNFIIGGHKYTARYVSPIGSPDYVELYDLNGTLVASGYQDYPTFEYWRIGVHGDTVYASHVSNFESSTDVLECLAQQYGAITS